MPKIPRGQELDFRGKNRLNPGFSSKSAQQLCDQDKPLNLLALVSFFEKRHNLPADVGIDIF